VRLRLRRYRAAAPLFEEAVKHRRRTAGEPGDLAVALEGLAAVRQGLGDEEDALELRLEALAVLRAGPEDDVSEERTVAVVRAHRALARSLRALGRRDEADEELRRGIDLLSGVQAPPDLLGDLLCDLGEGLEARGELEEAGWKLAECRRLRGEVGAPSFGHRTSE
jgi:tetratricopeptide (TPR) repeat protein